MAQLRLKQLDSVLTGSLQVSGSSGVTGSLSVSLTGSFAKITTNAGSFGTYAHAQADELLVYGSGSEVGMTLASNDISGSQYINFSKGDQDAHTQRVGYIKFKHGGEGGGSTGDRYLEVGIAGRDNSLNTILRLRNRFDLNNSNVTYNGKHALYGNGLYIKDGDLEVETNITVTHITASGNISASGTIYADNFTSTGGDVAGISFADDLNITGHITASGDINTTAGRVYEAGTSVIDHATAMAIVFGG
jgi:hypothetical protein